MYIYAYICNIANMKHNKLERKNFLSWMPCFFKYLLNNGRSRQFRVIWVSPRNEEWKRKEKRNAIVHGGMRKRGFFLCAQNTLRSRGESLRENCETNGWPCLSIFLSHNHSLLLFPWFRLSFSLSFVASVYRCTSSLALFTINYEAIDSQIPS